MYKHISVLLEEAINGLNIKEDGVYVDCTLGGGGHSNEILKKLKNGRLIAFDQDDYAIDLASKKLSNIGINFTIIKSNFRNIKRELEAIGITKVDGVLYDLGVSSFQFDIPERGFSYNYDAKLDMRMDQTSELTARTIVNEYDYHELVKILYKYSEEKFAKQIARMIEKERQIKPIETTFELVDVIKQAIPMKFRKKGSHPAKKTFQALRIAVNDELQVFEQSLQDSLEILNSGGRVVVISFHSLEDRITKVMFKEKTTVHIPKGVPIIGEPETDFSLINRKVIVPSENEVKENNRSHSAKMRIIEKK